MKFPNQQTRVAADFLFSDPRIRNVLNIGFRPGFDRTVLNMCRERHVEFTVLEKHGPACAHFRKTGISVIECDVRDIRLDHRKWDAIHWLHGPEKIPEAELWRTLDALVSKARVHVLLQTPYGSWKSPDRPLEKNFSALYPVMFLRMGWNILEQNVGGEATFTAVKWICSPLPSAEQPDPRFSSDSEELAEGDAADSA